MTKPADRARQEQEPLPRLRRDVQIELIAAPGDGMPAMVVVDPVRNNYFRLSWPESGILLLWQESTSVEEICATLSATYGLTTTPGEVAMVVQFAHNNQLTISGDGGNWQRYAALHASSQHGWIKSVLHGYLFFRIPILRPERMLRRLLPMFWFVYSRRFWSILAIVALIAVYLATQQWTAIISAVHDVLRLQDLHIYAAALFGLKALHELGHGLTTVRYGCRVPSMGIALIIGAPVLYTDTSDSWRLARRSERLAIVFAGVAAEMIVATLAILLWSFLPDGLSRQIWFALATTSLVLSLVVNLNPLMRFDGYFALSDYLDIPNLQSRAFDLGLWKLRAVVFGLGHPPPEVLPRRTQRILITYAVLTAIYRLIIFLGIAAVVYVVFGKAIGIPLALLEIGYFIVLPIVREFTIWWKLSPQIVASSRSKWTAGALAAGIAVLFIPWMSAVEVPAVLAAKDEEAIYLPFPTRLATIEVSEGQTVKKGDVLFTGDSSDLLKQHRKAMLDLRLQEIRFRRLHAYEEERQARIIIESDLARAREKVSAIERQLALLVLRAPFDGRVIEIDPEIAAGLWLNQKRPLARLTSAEGTRGMGLVSDIDVMRIKPGAAAVFVPDDAAAAKQEIVISHIAPAGHGQLAEPMLSDRYGGSVPSGEDSRGLRTRNGWFEVTFQSATSPAPQLIRGVARVAGERISPARLLGRQIARVLVREQGF